MKKFVALALVTLGVSASARAQWIVFDPTMNVQSIINTAQEIAKYIEMINNQVQHIQTLTDQLNEFKHYEDLFSGFIFRKWEWGAGPVPDWPLSQKAANRAPGFHAAACLEGV
jgi:hypothetical protein